MRLKVFLIFPGVFALLTACGNHSTTTPVPEETAGIRVTVDPRVELVGIVYRLGGHPEFVQGTVRSYLDDVDRYFKPYAGHPVVTLSREFRTDRGVSFDAVMQLALHIDDAFSPEPLRPLNDDSLMLYSDGRWTPEDAGRFIEELADFSRTSDFRRFFADHEKVYEHTSRKMRALIDSRIRGDWFETFFGETPESPLTVVPAIINGPASYGPKYRHADGKESFYAIIGVNTADEAGMPEIDTGSVDLIVHEFCHSFVNPLVHADREELGDAAASMFAQVEPAMNRMAYGNWETMLNESLVRAAVIRYLDRYEGERTASKRTKEEVDRSFFWMPELVSLLEEYEGGRDRYVTFESFMPEVIVFFDGYAPRLREIIAEHERRMEKLRPHVESCTPANGAGKVDPDTRRLILVFDRPMLQGYALTGVEGDAESLVPPTTNPAWNDDNTVLTMDTELEKNRRYAFSLNTEQFVGFKSRDGVALRPYVVRFSTGDGTE